MQKRVIFHADCNSFYASVELLAYPQLKDKPVAVSGSKDARHGIILAKNEAAKKFNVQTAETVWQAKRKCPELTLLPPNHSKYREYHKIINQIYAKYTDRVETFGIDESWLDVSGSWQLFGASPLEVAHILRQEVLRETGLTVSVGVSYNKVFAKMGSDYKKPNAVTEITQDNFKQLLWQLPAGDLFFVGKKTAELLKEVGITTIGEIAAADSALLVNILGKQGKQLHIYANGEDDAPVAKIGEEEPIKSVGNGLTFKRDLQGRSDVRTAVGALADEVATRLRRYGLYAASVQVMIKSPDFKTISRQKPTGFSTNLAKDIVKTSMELISDNWSYAKPIRMLTITAQQLSDLPLAEQISFFEEKNVGLDKKAQSLEKSMDTIREKFGRYAILSGGEIDNDIGLHHKAAPKAEEEDDWDF